MARWKEGAFSQQAVYPVECVTPIQLPNDYDDAHLACMYYLCVSYGAFLRAEFKPGQSVLMNGATGNLGSASVLMALALGASKIYAAGRNTSVLNALAKLAPQRIETVILPEKAEDYLAAIASKVTAVDTLIDAVGSADHAALAEAGISALRARGTAVFAGGVSTDVRFPYMTTLVKEINIKGSFMYPDSAPAEVLKMIQAGLLDLNAFAPQTYPLLRVNEAIAQAPQSRGLAYVILQP